MKYFIFISLASITFLSLSCKKDEVDYLAGKDNLIASFEVPAGLNNIETHYFRINNVKLFLKETIEANALSSTASYKISGSKGRLVSRLGQVEFSTFAEVTVDAISISDPTKRKEIFYQEEIPFNLSNELKLFTSLSEISDIIENDKVHLDIGIRFRSFSSIPADLDLEFGYVIFQ